MAISFSVVDKEGTLLGCLMLVVVVVVVVVVMQWTQVPLCPTGQEGSLQKIESDRRVRATSLK